MFAPVSSTTSFAAIEEEILRFWDEHGTFKRSLEARRGCPEFSFYDGPPFATGLPHYGHLLAGTIKDIVPRYETMRGYYVDRRFGWDCHGLPVEYEVEQDLGLSGKSDIETMGVDVFNEKCRSIVLRYTEEWRKTVTRMGRWVDFERDYKTMDPDYMESIWWVFRQLWERGLVYEGKKVLPYCARCSTPLSNFETNQGYVDVTDPAITVRFKIEGMDNAYLLAWTTTPWTLPSNMALAVGTDIIYARVRDGDDVYYLARARVEVYYRDENAYDELTEVGGGELVGWRYEPLFPYFIDRKAEGAFRVVAGDFVSTAEGSGIVHVAPGFGEDDYRVGLEQGIPDVCPVDAEGRFTAEVPDYEGQRVKDTDEGIMRRLKDEGKLVHRSTIVHSYPHCWRCDMPLIYRGISTWFVSVVKIKDRLLAANRDVHWVPGHLRDGRFGKWLENARDWAISRNRYWGTPLPVWRSEDGEEVFCPGSIAELEAAAGCAVTDLHKHRVDDIEVPSQEGRGVLRRVPEVLDCWFESGSMPYAQAHYPFENKEQFERNFPADFVGEGLDQTRGWFYTLMVLSVALFDRAAFKNVVVNGLILAEDGKKMSKRLKNYPDPQYMIDTYGADALRLYMIHSPVVRAEDLRFSEKGVQHLLRHILIPLWNSYSFFVTYANIDGWQPDGEAAASTNVLDRWILSATERLIEQVTEAMDVYDLQRSVRPFVQFIEDLTNWYIRRSRRRFWKSQDDEDKAQAYRSLYTVLLNLSKVAAAFIPFVSDSIYRNLRTAGMPESVHLCDFPTAAGSHRDPAIEERMTDVMTVVRLGRGLRVENDLKVRQPLSTLHVVSRNRGLLDRIRDLAEIVCDELNVKSLAFGDHEEDLAILEAKAEFSRLGPRFGSRMKTVARAIREMSAGQALALAGGGHVTLRVADEQIDLAPEDVVIDRTPREGLVVASEGDLVVALETELTEDLVLEGLAREVVNKVQNMRKNAGLEVTQRITVSFAGDEMLTRALERHGKYVCVETLCSDLSAAGAAPAGATSWDVSGHPCALCLSPVDA